MSKRVLILANITNVHTHRFVREFCRRGLRVHVISIQPPNRNNREEFSESIVSIPTHLIYRWLLKIPFFRYSEFHNVNTGVRWFEPYSIASLVTYIFLLIRIRSITRRLRPHGIFAIYLTMNGVLAALTGHPRIVASAAGIDVSVVSPLRLTYWINHPALLRFATARAYRIIGFDKPTFEPIFRKKGCRTENAVWMPHWGVDTSLFSPRESPRDGGCRFICSRPFRRQFDYESILLALRKVHAEHPDIEFVIASGSRSPQNMAPLRKLLVETGCDKLGFVTLLPYIRYEDLPILQRECDVYIDPINICRFPETRHWGVSGSLLEAMSCGLIPVISRRPGIDWIMPPEASKFLYDDFETGLFEALLRAAHARHDMRVRAAMRQAVIEKANWAHNLNLIQQDLVPAAATSA